MRRIAGACTCAAGTNHHEISFVLRGSGACDIPVYTSAGVEVIEAPALFWRVRLLVLPYPTNES